MNRKAASEFLAPLFMVLSLFLLIHGMYFALTSDFSDLTAPEIGTKQELIYRAEQQRQALTTYATIAAEQALRTVESTADPTENYLERAAAEFNRRIVTYPIPQTPTFTAERQGDTITFTSGEELHIPLVTAEERARLITAGGPFTTWPIDTEMRITSLFGKRQTNVGGSRNHAGIDIGVPGARVGAEVRAVQAGRATPHPWGVNLETVSGWVCEYLHVQATIGDDPVDVTEGQVIAEVINDGYTPHVDLRCHNPSVLTATAASSAFGQAHTGDANTAPADTTYSVVKDPKAYFDPYCLFSEDLQAAVSVPDTLSGFAERTGATNEEKLLSTCNAYAQQGLLAQPVTDADATTLTAYHTTLENLNTQQYRGAPLMALVREVAEDEDLDANLVIAMIAAESQGVMRAMSDTGVRGLMQVTCDTARSHVTIESCDDLYDPATNLIAGTKHWKSLLERWEGYTHQVAYAAAEYNGGGVVRQVAGDAPGRAYEAAMRELTPERLRDAGYSGTRGDLLAKIDEIANHGRKVARYYEVGGGSLPPLDTSKNRIGTLSFHLTTTAERDAALIDLLEELKTALRRCNGNCEAVLEQPSYASRLGERFTDYGVCTTYTETVLSRVEQCAQQLADGCACEIPLPENGQALFEPDQLVVNDNSPYLDWFGQADEDFRPVRYFLNYTLNETLVATPNNLSVAGRRARGVAGQPTMTVPAQEAFWVRKHIAETGDWYVLDIQTAAPNASEQCEQRVVENYCFDDVTLRIEHTFTPQTATGAVEEPLSFPDPFTEPAYRPWEFPAEETETYPDSSLPVVG